MRCRRALPFPSLSFFALLLTLLQPAAFARPAAARPAAAPKETWYGLFLTGKRVGYLVSTEQRSRWRGKPAEFTSTRMRMDLRVMGKEAASESYSRMWSTPEGAPLEESSVERTGERVTRIRAVYGPRSVSYQADLAGLRRSGKLVLKPGERFWSGDPFKGRGKSPVSGQFRYKRFNTTTLSLDDADVAIGRRGHPGKKEIVEVGGQGVAAYKIPFNLDGAPGTAWVDKNNEMLRADIGPARFVRLPRQTASAPLSSTVEVTDIASYAPDKPISHPRALRTARFRIDNMSAPPVTTDDEVQTTLVRRAPSGSGAYVAEMTITTGPSSDAPPTPLTDIPRTEFAAYLKPSLYVPSDTAAMKSLANRITGDETDARRAADTLSAWVHANLTYDPGRGIGAERHAAEILKSRRGVCQDYSTLLVTLARAAGIPAKHCGGLVYSDGRFFLHAWVELWVGRWVAFEPTWGTPFVDATHIKLEEGEPTTGRKGLSRLDALHITFLGTDVPSTPTASGEAAAKSRHILVP